MSLDKSDKIIIEKPTLSHEEELQQFHTREYIDLVKDYSQNKRGFLDKGDTPAFEHMFEAGCFVVGSTLKALDIVMTKKDNILHSFNPIGGLHHAKRNSAGGFCIFNDIGIIITTAKKKYNLNRICYVDIDAHHGDGVYYEFENDPTVFIADIHEDGHFLYPGTGNKSEIGLNDAKGTKLNIPLRPNSGDIEFIDAFKKIEKFIESKVNPELIILQCGTDGIGGDPLTHLQYSSNAHRYAAEKLHGISHRYCDGKIIALGGGGYNQENIGKGWTQVVRSFISDI
jgi:acetoin utilization protein AcuC